MKKLYGYTFGGGVNTVNEHNLGGLGVYMEPKSTFSILPNTILYWENNYATFGGAIYVHNVRPLSYCHIWYTCSKEECSFQLPAWPEYV